MPKVKKKTLLIACSEIFTVIATACLLSASINSTTSVNQVARTAETQVNLKNAKLIGVSSIIDDSIEPDYKQIGRGSWYGRQFHRRKTASGERFDMHGFTAAHRTLPFGAIVRVTDLNSNKSILVCINDRGPFIRNKIIDMSQKAAETLGGALKNLKLEAYLPGKSLPAYNSADENSDMVIGFGADRQLKALSYSNDEPWAYAETFSSAISMQKELLTRYPGCDALIAKSAGVNADEKYALFLMYPWQAYGRATPDFGAL